MPAIGPVAPGAHMVHRARSADDLTPACGHTTHGRLTAIVEVIAEPLTASLLDARVALISRDEPACRLCRRCWRSTKHLGHEKTCWRKP